MYGNWLKLLSCEDVVFRNGFCFNKKTGDELTILTLISKLRFSFTGPYFLSRSSGEKLLKYQLDSFSLIMDSILMSTQFYKALIFQGEMWCWPLLGLLKRVNSDGGVDWRSLLIKWKQATTPTQQIEWTFNFYFKITHLKLTATAKILFFI